MTDHIEQMRTNRQDFDFKVESIHNHPDYTPQAKQRFLGELYSEASAEYKRLASEHAEERASQIDGLEKKVFSAGIPNGGTAQERVAVAIGYCDAVSRAAAAVAGSGTGKGAEALQDLIDRAERSGDNQQAMAAYHVSREKGFYSVGDAYASGRPKVKDLWDRYTVARNGAESVEGKLIGAGTVGALAPAKPRDL